MEIKPITNINPALFSKFDCDIDELNTYLKRFAKKNDKLNIGKTYILLDNTQALGFYTISMAQIKFKLLPKPSQKNLPKYPIPAARIGRLAIDSNAQGSGLGELILMDALTRSLRVSEEIALFAVIVDAKDQRAENFYLKYGFLPLEDQKHALFLPMDTIDICKSKAKR